MMCWEFIAAGFNKIAEKRQSPEDGWVLVVISGSLQLQKVTGHDTHAGLPDCTTGRSLTRRKRDCKHQPALAALQQHGYPD